MHWVSNSAFYRDIETRNLQEELVGSVALSDTPTPIHRKYRTGNE